MKKVCVLAVLTCAWAISALGEGKVFDWVKANSETVLLDPSEFHTGRSYRPYSGGNIHVDISARQPITIAMTYADDWDAALKDPAKVRDLVFLCLREHVVTTTYTCELPPGQPIVLLVRDERAANRVLLNGIGAVLGRSGARQFIAPNDVTIQYYSWSCVSNCIQPEFQWSRLVKEKYELTSLPKIYNLLTPERDGQQLNLRIKAPVPMTVAVLPSQYADQLYDNPSTLSSLLSKTACKQRGVQSLSFECTFNLADGPQSIVAVPDSAFSGRKKVQIELQTVKCVANCNLQTE